MPASATARPAGDFSGLWIPMVTPFRDGDVDHAALAALVTRLAHTGIAGFVVCGSTGEAAALDKAEQLACLRTVAAHAGGLPLVMGLSGYHLDATRDWVMQLTRETASGVPPLAGLLVPPPHYIRPGSDGLGLWFRALADASGVPLILYDIPYRTGAVLPRELLLSLAAHPNIRAIKDCGGDTAKTLAVVADGRLQVLAGEDLQVFATVAQGGSGAIAASAHVQPQHWVAMLHAIAAGRLADARRLWQVLVPLVERLFSAPNPGPIQGLLARHGWLRNELRAPMTCAPAPLVDDLVKDEARLSRL